MYLVLISEEKKIIQKKKKARLEVNAIIMLYLRHRPKDIGTGLGKKVRCQITMLYT